MVRNARTAWRWLDLVPAFRRLTFALACTLLFALALVPRAARANTPAGAWQACSTAAAWVNTNEPTKYGGTASCAFQTSATVGQPGYYLKTPQYPILGCGGAFGEIPMHSDCLTGSPYLDNNPCLSLLPVTSTFGGPLAEGWSTTIPTNDPASGAMVQCTVVYHALSPCNYNSKYGWQCYGTLTPTGNPANDGDNSGAPGDWSDAGGGKPAVPPPAPPSPLPPSNTNPPQQCGGGSCYDPNTGNYCAVAGGSQVCVPGDTARTPPGACVYSSGAAVCAGSPNAPRPDPAKVPDPPSDIRSTDKYQQTTTTTATPITVTTNVFAQPGTSTNSGQTSSDTGPSGGGAPTTGNDGPASSSSAPSTGGTYGGGGDCATPPICTGDAATCGAARQQWVAMCLAHGDQQALQKSLNGDGSDPSIPSGPSKADVWTDGTSTGDGEADSANQGSYDTSGFGFDKQCPMTDITIPLWDGKTFLFAMSKGCVVGQWLHAIIIAFALFAAAKITAGAN